MSRRFKKYCPKGHLKIGKNLYINPQGARECRRCKRERYRTDQYRKWAKTYRDKNKKKIRLWSKKTYEKRYRFLNELKKRPCLDCGRSYPPYVMEFHHRDPRKKKSLVGRAHRKQALEILKCDLLCANCHRERTFGPIDKYLKNRV